MFKYIEDGESNMTEEDRVIQIEKITKKLYEIDDESLLDIADHVHWGVLKFYKPSTESIIPKKLLEKIKDKYPELLV
jgi:hypothetical protein